MVPADQAQFPEVLVWFKSSHSGGNTTECVEAARLAGGAAVRDSKDPGGAQLVFHRDAWAGFVGAVRNRRV
ncbi:DUF397 domain-containing protein [Streptomyces sp. NPDC006923]|uniref:DUF397 domain-containing protein n=1 Tax=Streptomyces sp. NPDC006923 TaxID=3155355 RepID=UPI0033D91BE2